MTPLLASGARVVSGSFAVPGDFSEVVDGVFLLTVSAAATVVGDTLDVYLQHSPDVGTTWDDFVHFTQVLGNGGAKKFLARWTREATAPTTPNSTAPRDATLAAATTEQGPLGGTWRVKWVIAGATPNFTFQLGAQLRRQHR